MLKAFVRAEGLRGETHRYGENPAEFQTYLNKTRGFILELLKDIPTDHTFSPLWFQHVTNGFSVSITPNVLELQGFDTLRMQASITKSIYNPLSENTQENHQSLYVDVDILDTETKQSLTSVTYKLNTANITLFDHTTKQDFTLPKSLNRHTQLIQEIVGFATITPNILRLTPVSILRNSFGEIVDTH